MKFPTVVTSQNVFMRKLGLAGVDHVESSDFGRYLHLFIEGLSKEQVQLICELFMSLVPPQRRARWWTRLSDLMSVPLVAYEL
jgi:hypothetical protein